MSLDEDGPAETVWRGKFIEAKRRGRWEYASRPNDIGAAVIVAVDDGHVLLVEQYRVPIGKRCLELPAGLVGDEGSEEPSVAALRELEEETGYRAERAESLGSFYSSPGMADERFELFRAIGLTRIHDGGGVEGEDIAVHRVALNEVSAFVAERRAADVAIDVKLLLLIAGDLLGA